MDSQSGKVVKLEPVSKGHDHGPATGSTAHSPASGEDNGGLIDLYLEYSKDAPSPERFRRWAAIHAVGAAGERRVWTQLGTMRLFPNLYIFLVGPPGTGKSVGINPMSMILRKSQAVTIAPSDMTKQGLLDALAAAGKGSFDSDGLPFDYHFMAICISELSNFMSQYDGAIAGVLTDLFDCPPMNEEKKRSGQGKAIPFPGLSFIMGTATKNLGATISREMFGSGFMARVVMVYADDIVVPDDMFAVKESNEALADEMSASLRRIGQLRGEMSWERPAQLRLRDFRINQKADAPLHNLLEEYVTRRWMHLAKLCMVAALSDERMTVRLEDVEAALSWLKDAEALMPEIFKDMQSHSDGQVYEDLQSEMWGIIMKTRTPFSNEWVWAYLSSRVSSYSVPRCVEVAEGAGFIQRVAGTSGENSLWLPGQARGSRNAGII